ncbi:hypothetical protein EXE43_02150 [Halorubrum sp. SS5]|nr:hypothetical protein EXE43_02150 [Halorubrum sp. SS5]
MYTNRHPIRDIREEYLDNTDRFAAFHEHRVDPNHSVRHDEEHPLAVIHLAPKLAFSKAPMRFPVPELLEREVRLHSASKRPHHPKMMADRVTSVTDPDPSRGEGGREINLYENAVVEIITGRAAYKKGDDYFISNNSLVNGVTGNLATILSLLADRRQDQNALVTATYLGFDGVRFNPDRPTSPITADHIQTPVLSFSGPDSTQDEVPSTYDLRTEYVNELFRPLFHSIGHENVSMDIPETIELPDLSTGEQ